MFHGKFNPTKIQQGTVAKTSNCSNKSKVTYCEFYLMCSLCFVANKVPTTVISQVPPMILFILKTSVRSRDYSIFKTQVSYKDDKEIIVWQLSGGIVCVSNDLKSRRSF